jgi:hypothetical protein
MAMTSTPTPSAERANPVTLDIPDLIFDNRTEFDALHFDMVDQHGQAFHVIVAKTGYSLGHCDEHGETVLEALDEPAELNVEDEYYDDDFTKSVKQESDLAPYKPYCDVIVNTNAYAPQGQAAPSFKVQLHVQLPDKPAPLPQAPQSLNPLQSPQAEAHQHWQQETERAKKTQIAGDVLINKVLQVTGERYLNKSTWGSDWKLSETQSFTQLPLRYEFAVGGQCRIEASDAAAESVPQKFRLTAQQLAEHPDKNAPPVAHDACMTNPLGCGFTRDWYLKSTGIDKLVAPRIEYPAFPFNVEQFMRVVDGDALSEPAGLGFVGRGFKQRAKWIGQIEVKTQWAEDEVPLLPLDFNFQYWNGAPEDQQCQHLQGQERFTLVNLCAHNTPYANTDKAGNTLLKFQLPKQALFVLAAQPDGVLSAHSLMIDTVIIDTEEKRVDLVWRICLPADGSITHARLLHADKDEQLARLKELQTPHEQSMSEHNEQSING